MKKILLISTSLLLSLGLFSCGSNKDLKEDFPAPDVPGENDDNKNPNDNKNPEDNKDPSPETDENATVEVTDKMRQTYKTAYDDIYEFAKLVGEPEQNNYYYSFYIGWTDKDMTTGCCYNFDIIDNKLVGGVSFLENEIETEILSITFEESSIWDPNKISFDYQLANGANAISGNIIATKFVNNPKTDIEILSIYDETKTDYYLAYIHRLIKDYLLAIEEHTVYSIRDLGFLQFAPKI